MPVKIKLLEGEELRVNVDVDEFTKAFDRALATGQVIRVEDKEQGRSLTINPQSVAYYYLDPAEAPEAEEAREPVAG